VHDVLATDDRAEIIHRAETEEDVFRRGIIPAQLHAKHRSEQPEV